MGGALWTAEGLGGTNADEGVAAGALLCVTAVDLELYLAMAITTASTAKKKMTCDLFICR